MLPVWGRPCGVIRVPGLLPPYVCAFCYRLYLSAFSPQVGADRWRTAWEGAYGPDLGVDTGHFCPQATGDSCKCKGGWEIWLAVCTQPQLPTLFPIHGFLCTSEAVSLIDATPPPHAPGLQSFLSGLTLSQHPFTTDRQDTLFEKMSIRSLVCVCFPAYSFSQLTACKTLCAVSSLSSYSLLLHPQHPVSPVPAHVGSLLKGLYLLPGRSLPSHPWRPFPPPRWGDTHLPQRLTPFCLTLVFNDLCESVSQTSFLGYGLRVPQDASLSQ